MKVEIPSYFEVKLHYESDYEMCFLCGALCLSEYSQYSIDRDKKYIYTEVDIEEVDNFQLFIDDLQEQLERNSDLVIDYTI